MNSNCYIWLCCKAGLHSTVAGWEDSGMLQCCVAIWTLYSLIQVWSAANVRIQVRYMHIYAYSLESNQEGCSGVLRGPLTLYYIILLECCTAAEPFGLCTTWQAGVLQCCVVLSTLYSLIHMEGCSAVYPSRLILYNMAGVLQCCILLWTLYSIIRLECCSAALLWSPLDS